MAFKTMMEETYDFLFIIMDLPKQSHCSSDAWYPAIAALKEAKKYAKCPVGLITSLEENMPEKFAKDLLRHAIIPLTGLENSLAAVKALQNVGMLWKVKGTPSIIWERWPNEKSRVLDEYQSKKVLNKIGINVPEGFIITDKNSLLNKFRTIKRAVALKAIGINHKTDVSGVVLGINNEKELLYKFNNMKRLTKSKEFLIERQVDNFLVELLVGIVRDPQHGFVITIAEGGVLSELRKDSVTLCMPCNKTEIVRALEKLRIWPLFNGYRNKKAVNIDKLVSTILVLQRYALKEKDKLVELEINPLLVKSNQVVAADALIRENY